MGKTWRTYTSEQAGNVMSGLEILIQKNLLTRGEKERAKSLQRRLAFIAQKQSDDYSSLEVSGAEDELLSHVEASLWR